MTMILNEDAAKALDTIAGWFPPILHQRRREKILRLAELLTLEKKSTEIDRAAVLCQDTMIDVSALSPEVSAVGSERPTLVGPDGIPLTLKEVEKRLIGLALSHTGNDRTAAAGVLGISRSTLYEKLKALKES